MAGRAHGGLHHAPETPRGHPLAPYLPQLASDWLADDVRPSFQELEASVVFVDISGFTKLSEHLARRGRIGAEELAESIGSCFSELLAVAYGFGGELLKFGGDAMFLLFREPGHEVRACAAAVGMRRTLRSAGRLEVPGMRLSLRMSIGVETALFHVFLVGSSHRELIVTGPGASAVVALEAAAGAGEIVVGERTAAALRPSLLGPAKGPGHLLRRAPTLAPVPAPVYGPRTTVVSAGIPMGLRTHLLTEGHQPEHRLVAVAFIHYDGTDAMIEALGPEATAARLDRLVSVVQAAADHRDVTFLGTDVDHDGGKIILAAGAPSSSGDDERRLLLALREVLDAPLELPVRIGVNRGAVFAGDVGAPYRRTYTVMGDAVNLAARLMARASAGELLATRDVVARSAARFETSAIEPFFVKGKEHPVAALRVGDVALADPVGRPAADLFVGRETELGTMLSAAEAVRGGAGAVVEILGEPGLGKSRLVEELRRRAPWLDHQTVVCDPYESATPYFPFRRWLRALLEIGRGRSAVEAAADLEDAIVRLAPDLAPWTPLIASVMDIPVPDTPQTAQLEPRFRSARLGSVIGDLLVRRLVEPTLVVVEDAHWMDDASAELVRHLAGRIEHVPWLLCVTARDELTGLGSPGGEVATLRLAPLDAGEASALAHRATGGAAVAPQELDALTARAGGNPLFLTELLAARAAGELESLPDSLEALITARIDRLEPSDRTLLRRAAVLGQSFSHTMLEAVVDEVPDEADDIWTRVDGLLHRDGPNVAFVHALVRDGAYASLPYRTRRELHARAGDEISRRAGHDLDDHAELLSLHYFHAQRFPDAWVHTNTAADRAAKIYANIDAAELYERALECARHLPTLDPVELARVHEILGDVRSRLASYTAAEDAYRAARRNLKGDPVAEARMMLRIAWVMGWRDGYSRALRWITRGLRLIEDVHGPDASRQRTRLLAWYGQFCQQQGHHTRAMRWCRRAVAEADDSNHVDALAHAYKVLGWAEMDLGRLDSAPDLVRALELYEQLGDLPGQASVHNLLGGFKYWRGEWSQALDNYERARALARRTGDMILDAFCASNIGEIALDQGHVAEAEVLFSDALRVWEAAGDRPGTAYAKCSLARVASRTGRSAEAFVLFDEAERESRRVGAHVDALEARARQAEALMLDGQTDAALALAEAVVEQLRAQGGVGAQAPLLHRIRGAAHLRRGDLERSRGALEASLAAGRTRQTDYEVALTLEVLAEVATRAGDSSAQAFRAESSEILERLGVISIPDIVAGARASAPPVTMTTFEFVIDLSLEERRDVNTPDDEPRAPSAIGTSGRRPGD